MKGRCPALRIRLFAALLLTAALLTVVTTWDVRSGSKRANHRFHPPDEKPIAATDDLEAGTSPSLAQRVPVGTESGSQRDAAVIESYRRTLREPHLLEFDVKDMDSRVILARLSELTDGIPIQLDAPSEAARRVTLFRKFHSVEEVLLALAKSLDLEYDLSEHGVRLTR